MARAMFNLSHEHKTSCDMGQLIPVSCCEVLPGDTFIGSTSVLARIAPLVHPLMHRVEARVHHFYVPNRIIWDGWEKFITGEEETAVPQFTPTDDALAGHFGIGPEYVARAGAVNDLPFRAYNMIWNHFYRDQDLQSERLELEDSVARICWEKDYLTVCRPEPQQGAPTPIPIDLEGPLGSLYRQGSAYQLPGAPEDMWRVIDGERVNDVPANSMRPVVYNTLDDTSAVTNAGIDINDLRQSLALQRISEARAMYGERYIDYLRFLGVNPSDGRLDRPEYLGGGKQVVNYSEVLNTAGPSDPAGGLQPLGEMGGHGIVGLRSRRYQRMFEEHGYVLSLMSFRPKTVYQDGVPRHFRRRKNTDFWHKELEILPWQAVMTSEVHGNGASTGEENIFGYGPKYEEYRMGRSYVSGTFNKGTEQDWHMGRTFADVPALNGSFVQCSPTDRVYADTNQPECLVSVQNSILAKRLVRANAQIGAL